MISPYKKILAVIVIAFAVPLTVFFTIQGIKYFSKASSVAATLSFSQNPLVVNSSSPTAVNLVFNANTAKVGFVKAQFSFDKTKVQLASEIVPTTSLSKIISVTTMASANSTGVVTIILGLDPASVANAPTGSFNVASLSFKALNNTSSTSSLTFSSPNIQIVDMTATPFTVTANNATVNTTGPTTAATATPTSTTSISSLRLLNLDTQVGITGFDPLQNGATLNLATLPAHYALSAVTNPTTVGSVNFNLDNGAVDHTENFTPYCIAGKTAANTCNPWTFAVGSHTLTVTPFTDASAAGVAGTPKTITFTVTGTTTTTAPTPTPLPQPIVVGSPTACTASGYNTSISWNKFNNGSALTITKYRLYISTSGHSLQYYKEVNASTANVYTIDNIPVGFTKSLSTDPTINLLNLNTNYSVQIDVYTSASTTTPYASVGVTSVNIANCPGATAVPTAAPTASASPIATGSTSSLNFKVKLQGINSQINGGDSRTGSVIIKNGNTVAYTNTNVNMLQTSGIFYAGSVNNLGLVGTYDVYIKEQTHLQKKLLGLPLLAGQTETIDWSTSAPLLAGDFNNDNKIDITDIGQILAHYTQLNTPVSQSNQVYDINGDGTIDIQDIAIVLSNYTQLEVLGD